MKRFVSSMIAAALFACVTPVVTAYAADATSCEFKAVADKQTVHKGDTVTFTVSLTTNGDLYAFGAGLEVPADWTFVSAELDSKVKEKLGWTDGIIAEPDAEAPSFGGFSMDTKSLNTSTNSIVLGTITYTVGDIAVDQTITIGLNDLSAGDANGGSLPTTTVSATVKDPGLVLVPEKKANCKEGGHKEYYKCGDDCGKYYETNDRTKSTTLDKVKTEIAPHDFTKETVDAKYLSTPATCKDPAKYFKSCSVCGEKGTDTFTNGIPDATKHTGGKATCANKAVCTVCGQGYGATDPNNHEDINLAGKKDPTCTEPGNTGSGTCSACGVKVEGKEIPALGHKGGTATCNSKAVCDTCKKEYGEFDKTNHGSNPTELRNAKKATATEDGYTGDKVCTGCETILEKGTVIPMEQVTPIDPLPDTPSDTPSDSTTSSTTSSSSETSTDTASNGTSSTDTSSTDTASGGTKPGYNEDTDSAGSNGNVGNVGNSGNNNPATGITIAALPVLLAAGAAVVIYKNKKR